MNLRWKLEKIEVENAERTMNGIKSDERLIKKH